MEASLKRIPENDSGLHLCFLTLNSATSIPLGCGLTLRVATSAILVMLAWPV